MTIVRRHQGASLQVLSDTLQVKLGSGDSPNGLTVMTVTVASGGMTPPHHHVTAEEAYYVLRGELTMLLGEQEYTLHAGDFAHVLPGDQHSYRNNGTTPVEFLAWTIGGEMDHFFRDMDRNIRKIPDDLPKLAEVIGRHDVHMSGPDAPPD